MIDHLKIVHPIIYDEYKAKLKAGSSNAPAAPSVPSIKKDSVNCSFCNRHFANYYLRKVHEETHTGERSFGCGECEKRCVLKVHLMAHIRNKHPELEDTFFCKDCKRMFCKKDASVNHICVKDMVDKRAAFLSEESLGSESSNSGQKSDSNSGRQSDSNSGRQSDSNSGQ